MSLPIVVVQASATSVNIGQEAAVSAAGSSDPDGGALEYSWILVSRPTNSFTEPVDRLTVTSKITPDLAGDYVMRVRVTDDDGDFAFGEITITAGGGNSNNETPTANAGPPVYDAQIGVQYVLDGSGSSDPEGRPLSYFWSVDQTPNGSNVSLSNANVVNPAVVLDLEGDYTFRLVVDNGINASLPHYVLYRVPVTGNAGLPPVAQTTGNIPDASLGEVVILDASSSYDPDTPFNELTFFWEITESPTGSVATIVNTNQAVAELTGDIEGIYRTQVTVTDPEGNSDSANLFITMIPPNTAPVVTVSPDRVEALWGERIQINASVYDPDEGEYLSEIIWDQIDNLENPLTLYDENGNEGGETVLNPVLYAPSINGLWALRLVVRDKYNEPCDPPGLFVLEVSQPKTPPTTVVGADFTVNGGQTAQLDASGSYDEDPESILSYHWYQVSGTAVTLSDSQSANPTFTAPYVPATDTLVFRAITSDGNASSDGVLQTVTVNAWAGADPSAPHITLTGPAALTLPLGATYTEQGATARDDWDGAVTVSVSGTVNTNYVGSDTLTYTATDAAGNTSTVTRTVTTVYPAALKPAPNGAYHSSPAINPAIAPNLDLMHQSFVEGWLVRAEWKHIHLGPGQFDFSKIREQIDAAAVYGKGINLSIIDSLGSPQWMIDSVGHFDYVFRADIPAQGGLPWDSMYQYYKRELLRALGAEFDGDSNLRSVYFTYGAMSNGAEFHWRVDETEYAAAGYTPQKLLDGAKRLLDYYIESFPTTCITIECHPVFEDDCAHWLALYDYGYSLIGKRLGAGAWWAASRIAKNTTGTEGDASAYPAIVHAYNQGSYIVAQTIGNFTKRPDRFDLGAGWTTEEAFVNERLFWDGLEPESQLVTTCYEYWTKDLNNPDLTPYFVYYTNRYIYPINQVDIVAGQELVIIESDETLWGILAHSALVVPGYPPVPIDVYENRQLYLASPWPYETIQSAACVAPLGVMQSLDEQIAGMASLTDDITQASVIQPSVVSVSPGTGYTIDGESHAMLDITLNESVTTLDVTLPASGAREFTLILRQGSGNNTVNWSGVAFSGGSAVSLKTVAGEFNLINVLVAPTGAIAWE